MIRILLYTDEPVLGQGLLSILLGNGGFHISGTCSTMAEVRRSLESGESDVLLMDLTPEVTFAALSEIRRVMRNCRMVLWVHNISTELAFQAMGLGVRGILRKTLGGDLVMKCLEKVHQGELWFEKGLTDSFLSAKRISLTRREGQLITLLSQGMKNKEIASMLLISEGTVKVYLSKLFQKVGVKDRFELALYGIKNLTSTHGHSEKSESAEPHWDAQVPVASLRSLVMDRPPAIPTQLRPNGLRTLN